MNKIQHIFTQAEGRYLSKQEQQTILNWASMLEKRMRASDEIQSKEDTIARQTTKAIVAAFPGFDERFNNAPGKTDRDISLSLRYATQAMIRDDMQWLDDSLLYWFRTILIGHGMTPKLLGKSYQMVSKACEAELSAETWSMLKPYMDRVVEVMNMEKDPVVETVAANAG